MWKTLELEKIPSFNPSVGSERRNMKEVKYVEGSETWKNLLAKPKNKDHVSCLHLAPVSCI